MPLKRFSVLLIIIAISLNISGSLSQGYKSFPLSETDTSIKQDTLQENQILYNGRIWRNLYYMVDGDQFLFTDSYLNGDVIVRGKKFTGLTLKYDIFKDEVLIPLNTGRILQINKAMVDSFSFSWQNKKYNFTRLPADSSLGYLNVLYKGKSALYVKYRKKIEKLAEGGRYDKFYQTSQAYLVKDGIIHPVSGRKDLETALQTDKVLIKSFLRKNNLRVVKKSPESYIPLIRYLDTIR
ncbi:MAG: hypothetical protein IPH69_16790 [Bacteroidales bacterium]|nr:hypothetical protein [Bacteroidales bacterium]